MLFYVACFYFLILNLNTAEMDDISVRRIFRRDITVIIEFEFVVACTGETLADLVIGRSYANTDFSLTRSVGRQNETVLGQTKRHIHARI